MSDVKTIYLLRHGQSVKNADKTLYYSQTKYDHETELTQKGCEQASLCGQRLAAKIKGAYSCFVSPYLRATHTLDLILEQMPTAPTRKQRDGRLREQEWQFFSSAEEMASARAERNKQGKLYYRFLHGESGYDVVARAGSFLNQLRIDWMLGNLDNDVIIVCHEVTCRALMLLLLDAEPEMFEDFSVDNCAIQIFKAGPRLLFGKRQPRDLSKRE